MKNLSQMQDMINNSGLENLRKADEYIKQIIVTTTKLEGKLEVYINEIRSLNTFVRLLKDRYNLDSLDVLAYETVIVGSRDIHIEFDSKDMVYFGYGNHDIRDNRYIIIDHNGQFDLDGFCHFIRDNTNSFKSLLNILLSDKIYRLILASANDVIGYNVREEDNGYYVTHLRYLKNMISGNVDYFIQEMNKK